jgi:hypothetical protein
MLLPNLPNRHHNYRTSRPSTLDALDSSSAMRNNGSTSWIIQYRASTSKWTGKQGSSGRFGTLFVPLQHLVLNWMVGNDLVVSC